MSIKHIERVAVIGSGVMGAGIAAQIANAGLDVVLLDIASDQENDRSAIAKSAIAKMKKTKPAPLMHGSFAKKITPGNLEDDLELLKQCDWIIEVVVERLDIKQDLYKKIAKVRKRGAIVSSNTSTLPLEVLMKGMPKSLKENFLITHFFNPPRYLRLLEIVTGSDTKPEVREKIESFVDHKLGKSIVDCHDTPGFIANRIGTFWIHCAITEAIKQGISVEAADAVMSRPIGVPKTGVFGLVDLVGLDLMPHIFDSLNGALPKSDAFKKLGPAPDLMFKMIEDGYTGRKGKGGFYRLNEQKKKEVIDLKSGAYHLARRPKIKAALAAKKDGLLGLVKHKSKEGRYAKTVLLKTLAYAAELVPEITDTLEQVDRAMRLGYNFKFGPFELMDKIGTDTLADMLRDAGIKVPHILKKINGKSFYRIQEGYLEFFDLSGRYKPVPRPEGVLLLSDVKRRSKPLFKNSQASIWDVGDGVACLEFHSKMNSLNPFIMYIIRRALKEIPKRGFKGLVIHNEGTHFSVGANIAMLLVSAILRLSPAIRYILRDGQFTLRKMQKAHFPVVGAPSGMALGGGCEVLLHCDAVTAHAESYVGLVEAGVGIVPGWGGCKELLVRGLEGKMKGPMVPVTQAFENIATAKVATSAHEAEKFGFFRKSDVVVMNKERILAQAKAKVLAMAPGYQPREDVALRLPGKTGMAALDLAVQDFRKKGIATPHDVTIARELAKVLCGGEYADITEEVSELDILKLERDALTKLSGTKQTRARIKHMLLKGKPLRN